MYNLPFLEGYTPKGGWQPCPSSLVLLHKKNVILRRYEKDALICNMKEIPTIALGEEGDVYIDEDGYLKIQL